MLVNNGVAKNIIICLHVALNCCCKKLLCNKHATNSTQRNVEKKCIRNLNIHLVQNGNQFKTSLSASTIRSCWNLLLSVKSEFFMLFPITASAHPTMLKWTDWCRLRKVRVWPPAKRPPRGRTESDGLWTMRKMEWPTATPSSTSVSFWPRSTSWWRSQTGTSKYVLFAATTP